MAAIARAFALVLLLAATLPGPAAAQETEKLFWLKGNTHTHTLNSDGDSTPAEVAHWYRDHAYDFLVLTDHNYRTGIEELQKELDRENLRAKRKPFLLVPGEEVTDKFGEAQIHVNGLDTAKQIGKQKGESKHEVLQRCVDAIRAAGGVPSVNHPNYAWSITADDLAELKGLRHFEIFNGHPDVHNFGGGGRPGLEEMWDDLLTRDVRLFGLAVDDAHEFKGWDGRRSNPGQGWIMLRAKELSRAEVRRAYEAGEFYSSNGVVLEEIGRKGEAITVKIAAEIEEQTRFTTYFIGPGGKVLAKETGLASAYTPRPEDKYVRVRVVSSRAEYAWSQPFWRE